MTREFTIKNLEALQRDIDAGKTEFKNYVIPDGDVPQSEPGLRARVSKDRITFQVMYHVDGARHYFPLGAHPETSIEDARTMAKAAIDMSNSGIDLNEEMHIRLRRELLARGSGGGRA